MTDIDHLIAIRDAALDGARERLPPGLSESEFITFLVALADRAEAGEVFEVTGMNRYQLRATLFPDDQIALERAALAARIEAHNRRDWSLDIECTSMTDEEWEAFIDQF